MTTTLTLSGTPNELAFAENTAQSTPQLLFHEASLTVTTEGENLPVFTGGTLTLSGLAEDDIISVQGGDGFVLEEGNILFDGTNIGAFAGGVGTDLTVTFTAQATASAVEALIRNLTYKVGSDTPTETRTLTLALTDGEGNSLSPAAGTMAQYELVDYLNDPLRYIYTGYDQSLVMDFNNDGYLDVAQISSGGYDDIYVRLGAAGSSSSFTYDMFNFPEPVDEFAMGFTDARDLASVDYDGDGDLDVVIVGQHYYPAAFTALYTFRNNGDGSYTYLEAADNPYAGINVGGHSYVTFADFDNDGDEDFLGINFDNNIRTWLQGEDGSFTEATGSDNPFNGLINRYYYDPIFVDIDHDGDIDAILNDAKSTIYLNDGSGGFSPLTGDNPLYSVANNDNEYNNFNPDYHIISLSGDFDGDGDIDLASRVSIDDYTLLNITPTNPTIAITVTAEDDPTESYGIPEEMAADEDVITTLDLTEFSITDPDADGPKTITLTASIGTLFAEDAADVTITGQGTRELHLTGLIEDLSFFLSGEGAVSYQGPQDAFGDNAANIAVNVIDGETPVALGTVSVHIAEQWDDRYTDEHGMAEGDAGRDRVHGGDGAERLYGYAGTDELDGGAGNDRLDGGEAADLMTGGLGNDAYFVDDINDVVIEDTGFAQGGGIDTVHTSVNNYRLTANTEVLRMTGDTDLTGHGNDGDNILVGNAAANTLHGGGGNDRLVGNDGADVLIGNAGSDILNGGAGVDRFVFTSIADSRAGAANRDTINGFLNLREQIDLSAIDANTYNGAATNDAWTFIGSRAFDGTWGNSAGQLRTQGLGEGINAVLVEGDHNGDGVADFQILVNGTTWMTGSDFIL